MCGSDHLDASENCPFHRRTIGGRKLVRDHDVGAHGANARFECRRFVGKQQNVARIARIARGNFSALVADQNIFPCVAAQTAAEVA